MQHKNDKIRANGIRRCAIIPNSYFAGRHLTRTVTPRKKAERTKTVGLCVTVQRDLAVITAYHFDIIDCGLTTTAAAAGVHRACGMMRSGGRMTRHGGGFLAATLLFSLIVTDPVSAELNLPYSM